jgi:hypothetical protein
MTIWKILLLLFSFAAVGLARQPERVGVTQLRCEYRTNPEGIGEVHP